MLIRWSDLGEVTGEGEYHVSGVGSVFVTERDIANYEALGGDPPVTLSGTGSGTYRIRFIGAPVDDLTGEPIAE